MGRGKERAMDVEGGGAGWTDIRGEQGKQEEGRQSSLVAQRWVSKPVNVSRQMWMVGPEYTWYMRCSCIKVWHPNLGLWTYISIASYM